MNRERITHYTPLLRTFFVGLLIGSLIVGGLALDATALTLFVAALLIISRADVIPALLVIALGVIIIVLFRQFSFSRLSPTTVVIACFIIAFL